MIKNKIAISLVASSMLLSSAFGADTISNVVVTAKSNQTIEDTAGSVSIITAKDIKSMNATSIQEVLEEVVGINVGVNDSSIFGRKAISIRGMGSKHSLILIDGKRISGSDAQIGHSDFQYNWLPLSAIEKIEVVRGPMSALYGSKAIGGVVNIITKKPDEKISGDLDVKKGWSASDGGDEKDISLTFGGQITDNFSFAAFIEKQDKDLVKDKDDSTTTEKEGKVVLNKMLNLWYDIDDTQQLSTSIVTGEEDRETLTHKKYYEIEKDHKSIGYTKNFDDITMDLKYYTTASDSHTQQFEYTHELEDDVLNAEFTIDKFDNNFLVVGIEKRTEKYRKHYDDASDDATKGFKDEIDYKSAFIQDEIELNDKTILTLGTRYDKHERFGSELSPKANVVYKLDANSRLKAGYGQGFNAPTLTQTSDAYGMSVPIAFAGPGGAPSELNRFSGNDNLKPETSKSIELGYEFQKENTIFKTTIFQTKIKDLIEAKDNGDTVVGFMTYHEKLYSNTSKATMQGLEIEFDKKRIVSNLDLNIGYNYLKTEDEATGKELSAKPKHKLNIKFKSKLVNNIDGTLRVKHTGSQKDGSDKTLNSYTTVGLQFSKEFIKNFTARIGVENLTDERLNDDHNFQLDGRMVYVGLNYKF